MQPSDVRWKQRFENFQKAMALLNGSILVENPSILERAGLVQFFEMAYELAWNLLKDFLEAQGFTDMNTPRSAIKKAFESGIIPDGRGWMDLMVDRNLTVHIYDERKALEVDALIRHRYHALLVDLHTHFEKKAHES